MPDLNNVAAFVAVVDAGSFTGGARALQMPKGSISRKISRLEQDLGVRLLNRTTRRVSLTDAGHAYYTRCRAGLDLLADADATLADTRNLPQGRVRISAPNDFGTDQLGGIIDEYLEMYDQVAIDLVLTDRYLNLVEHRIDLAFRIGNLPDSTLITRRLGVGRAVLCAAPAYVDRAGTPDAPADLLFHDCIVHGRAAEDAIWRLTGPTGDETVRVKARVSGCTMQHGVHLVQTGHGIGLLPTAVIASLLTSGALVRVLDQFASPELGIFAAWPSNRQVSPAVRAFVDLAVQRLTGIGDTPDT